MVRDKDLTVVSFYTPDYKAKAERLMKKCDSLGLKHKFYAFAKDGPWGMMTSLSAKAVRLAMQEVGLPLLWIDADSEIEDVPRLLLDSDIVAPRNNCSRPDRPWSVYAIYFNSTMIASSFIQAWDENSKTACHPLCTDHYYFNRTIREFGSRITVDHLPSKFMKIIISGETKQTNDEFGKMRKVAAWWSKAPSPGNLGDILTPYMIRKEVGQDPFYGGFNSMLCAGSTIRLAQSGATIWGSGVMRECDGVKPHLKLKAVRGYYTKMCLERQGQKPPEVMGDPGILMPLFYDKPVEKKHALGFVPHYVDYQFCKLLFQEEFPVTNVLNANIEKVIDEIRSYEIVVTSSLHGLVMAEAYDIPYIWVHFEHTGRKLNGDGTKFLDFYSVFRDNPPESCTIQKRVDIIPAYQHITEPTAKKFNWRPLWDACPFRLDNIKK